MSPRATAVEPGIVIPAKPAKKMLARVVAPATVPVAKVAVKTDFKVKVKAKTDGTSEIKIYGEKKPSAFAKAPRDFGGNAMVKRPFGAKKSAGGWVGGAKAARADSRDRAKN